MRETKGSAKLSRRRARSLQRATGSERPTTIVDALATRCHEQGDKSSFVFLGESGGVEDELTFEQLATRAKQLASALSRRASVGDRILLCYPPGLEFVRAFYACLCAGLVAVPLYSPRGRQKLDRLRKIIESSEAALILTSSSVSFEDSLKIPHVRDGRVICTDRVTSDGAEGAELPSATAPLALLQYTSGSTGDPKGVMVSHDNVIANLQALRDTTGCAADDIFVNWLPAFHDLGLVNTILLPVFLGARSVLMAPASFIRRPRLWLEAITKYRGSIAGAPNFAFDLCVERVTEQERVGLDLSTWRIAFNAAEPVQARTLTDFASAFEASGFRRDCFYPSYGMAEATVFLTGGKPGQGLVVRDYAAAVHNDGDDGGADKARKLLVGCGRPPAGHSIKIIDPATLVELPEGSIGEIWASGPSIAQGYWNLHAETERVFGARMEGSEDRWLRTGDLGCFRECELFITGRIKDVLVIHGQNYYPNDIEQTVQQSHPALRRNGGAAFSVVADGQERLVIVQEMTRDGMRADPDEVLGAMLESVACEFELEVHAIVLIKPATLRKTSSGKVQRSVCKQQFGAGELAVVARYDREAARPRSTEMPATDLEAHLLEALRAALGVELGVTDNVFRLGLDSLSATRAVARLEARTGIRPPVAALFEHPSVRSLAEELARQSSDHRGDAVHAAIRRADRAVEIPLSVSQQRLWFLWSLHGPSASYNEYRVVKLPPVVDIDLLTICLNELIQRHEILRTRFREHEGQVVQVIANNATIGVDRAVVEDDAQLVATLQRETHRPFDLARDSLLRVALIRCGEGQWLTITMHHLITDGWSMRILVRELDAIYGARARGEQSSLPPLELQYADYAQWQREALRGPSLQRGLAYWRERLAGLPLVHGVMLDKTRPARQKFNGAIHAEHLNGPIVDRLRKFCSDHDVTLFMLFQSVFTVLLARFSGERDIVVGFPIAGRVQVALEPMLGLFVNTLVLRVDLSGNPSFSTHLERCKRLILEAYAHQDVPFGTLVEELNPQRTVSHGPLFQVLLSMHERVEIVLQGQRLEELVLPRVPVNHDLELSIETAPFEIVLNWKYNTDLFLPGTVVKMASALELLLAGFVEAPTRSIHSVDIVSAAERERILRGWNQTHAMVDEDERVHVTIEKRAIRDGRREAVVCGDHRLTYAELARRSNQLAHDLVARGLGRDDLVGLCMPRSVDTVVALLGILKAGSAYVPLDPDYPRSRVDFMLKDAGCRVVITHSSIRTTLPEGDHSVICLDDAGFRATMDSLPDTAPGCAVASGDLAYVIYTSGSTGQPKGVMIQHGSLANCVRAMQASIGLSEDDRWLAVTTLSFDIATLELLLPLSVGATVVMTEQGRAGDARYMSRLLGEGRITAMQATPATWQMLVASDWQQVGGLKAICGGEAMTEKLRDELLARTGTLWNVYGPTETTIWSTCCRMLPGGNALSIGRPIANTRLYVLSEGMAIQPSGVPGELYIGGAGVARGYLHRPELTKERFVTAASLGLDERLYRTGDRVRWHADGTVDFLGRIDEQVKLRGFRIELGEIEHHLSRIAGVQACAVVCRKDDEHDARLIAYVVPEPPIKQQLQGGGSQDEKRQLAASYTARLRAVLPGYMVPGVYVFLDALPLTPNGKLSKKDLPVPSEEDRRAEQFVASRHDLEEALCTAWAAILGMQKAGIHDDFFAFGGHSLLAMRLCNLIREEVGLEVSLPLLFEHPTPAGLAQALSTAELQTVTPSIERADRAGRLPLSYAQQRLWVYDQITQGSSHYNIAGGLELKGQLDVFALERAVHALIERHEVLRTNFAVRDGEPEQVIREEFVASITHVDLSSLPDSERAREVVRLAEEDAHRPFDLQRDVLLRVSLLRSSPGEHVMLFNVHHIAADGWSIEIMIKEFSSLYTAFAKNEPNPLPPLRVQYADYAQWQRKLLDAAVLDEQLAYWNERLAHAPLMHALPLDQPRPSKPSFRIRTYSQSMGTELPRQLHALSRQHDVTLFMVLQAAFSLLVSRYSGETDVVVGTTAAGRVHRDVEPLIGFLTNDVALRSDLSGNPTFVVHLARTKRTILDAQAHQLIPFQMLVEHFKPPRVIGQNPIIQIKLDLQNFERSAFAMPGVLVRRLEFRFWAARYDLFVNATEDNGELMLHWYYSTDIFAEETIDRLAKSFGVLLEGVVQDPSRPIRDFELLRESERQQLLADWNDAEHIFAEETQC